MIIQRVVNSKSKASSLYRWAKKVLIKIHPPPNYC